ncbi:MAG TPA: rod shape-determining protein MreD [Candidatus Cloacimonas sp.]|jgi:rod shape-determining protein MreD|nr:rod shape-determining protein MreD [Candidatus Cloacimonadota bacterium]HCX74018.1 rod shape-determining protein MreD [Candidatus Cloacimonas sp.]
MRIVKYILAAIILIYFQILIAPSLAIMHNIPNFLIPFVIFLALRLSANGVMIFAFFLGLAFDLNYPGIIGLNALSLTVIAFLVSNFHKSINKAKFSVVIFSIFLLVFLNDLFYTFFFILTNSPATKILTSNIISVFYNTAICFIMVYFFILLDRLRVWIDV